MLDTGQYGARKTVIPSPEAQQEVFDNFRERLKKVDLSFLDQPHKR